MKKSRKIILIICGVLFGIILIDTIQARILKNSPIISWKETLEDSDSWVDRGILMDTYYCTEEKDIITVIWKVNGTKFACPINNGAELNEVKGISMLIKDGTLTNISATVIITDFSGSENIYGESFRIDKLENGEWIELEPIGNYAFTSKNYKIDINHKLEFKYNWYNIYGELESGEYRLVKAVYYKKEDSDKYFSVEFKID